MLPADLKAEHFRHYPTQAAQAAVAYLGILRQLPLSFIPSLLRELIEYDYKFPAEKLALDRELLTLRAMSSSQLAECFQAFAGIRVLPTQERLDWVDHPAEFTDQFSAYLWSTHQMDAFRAAATAYGNHTQRARPAEPPPLRRLGIVVLGQGVASYDAPLFRKLREHGTYFSQVNPANGFDKLLAVAADRARSHPVPYGHWYVDGSKMESDYSTLTCVSYAALEPIREALLRRIEGEVAKPGMGPEELHARMARLLPRDLGMDSDRLLDHFQVKLLTEGSGTQIFSTTFVQWTAREVLRRAEALTLLVRFTPRQRERPMYELLSSGAGPRALDPVGSLVDADMAAYYQWINQQRLPDAARSSFLVWFEGHRQALAIGPTLPRGSESTSVVDLTDLLSLATS